MLLMIWSISRDFDPGFLKIDKKSYKNIGIYSIGYITIKKIGDSENIHSVNPLHLMIHRVNGYAEEKNGSKYLVLSSNNELMGKYKEILKGIKAEIKWAMKLYFMYCSGVVIIFFSPRLYKSAFSTYSLVKLVFHLFLF